MAFFITKPLCFVGLLAVYALSFAQESNNQDIEWTVGQEIYKETYTEFVSKRSGKFVQHNVPVVALFARVRIPVSERQKISLYGRYGYGSQKYIGSTRKKAQFGSLIHRGAPREIYEIQATYSYDLPYFNLTPSLGGGYRRLTDYSDIISSSGYRRISQYGYAMAGIESRISLSSDIELRPSVNYKYIVDARQYSLPSYTTKLFKQHHGYGFEVALPIRFRLSNSKQNAVEITPFYRSWHIGDSEKIRTVNAKGKSTRSMEPRNVTKEVGINASYSF